MQMNSNRQVQEDLLKVDLDQEVSVVSKVSMINSDKDKVQVHHHLEMYLKNSRNFSQVVVAEVHVEVLKLQQREKILW